MSQNSQFRPPVDRINTSRLRSAPPVSVQADPSKVLPDSAQSRFDSAFSSIFGESKVIHSR